MREFRHLSGVTTLSVDSSRCTGCGLCADVCPHAVLVLREGRVEEKDRDACIECGACALNCPTRAISVEAGVGCASGMINEWLRGLKLRRGAGGCC